MADNDKRNRSPRRGLPGFDLGGGSGGSGNSQQDRARRIRSFVWIGVILVLVLLLLRNLAPQGQVVNYSQFLGFVRQVGLERVLRERVRLPVQERRTGFTVVHNRRPG